MSGYYVLLLAAGAGTRFGGRKLLAPWHGEPLVRAAARRALAAPVEACVAVTGCDAISVEAALGDLLGPCLLAVRAANWRDGLSASLRRGIAALPGASRGVVVFLGDMPLVPCGAAGRLIDALALGAVAAEHVADGRPAHPVAFGCTLYPELMSLAGDTGGRGLLAGRPGVARIDTDQPGATFDVGVPSDLDKEATTSRPPVAW